MHSAFFDGRSRQNRMTLARDHRPTREAILADTQRARQKRDQDRRRQQSAQRIQRAARRWQAEQAMIARCLSWLDHLPVAARVSSSQPRAPTTTAGDQSDAIMAQLETSVFCFRYLQSHTAHIPRACLTRVWNQSHPTTSDATPCDRGTQVRYCLEHYTGVIFQLVHQFLFRPGQALVPVARDADSVAVASSTALDVLRRLSAHTLVSLVECVTRDLFALARDGDRSSDAATRTTVSQDPVARAAAAAAVDEEARLTNLLAPWCLTSRTYTAPDVAHLLEVFAQVAEEAPATRWAVGAAVLRCVAEAGAAGAAPEAARSALAACFAPLLAHGMSDLFPTPALLTSASGLTPVSVESTVPAVGAEADAVVRSREAWDAALWACLVNTSWSQDDMRPTTDGLTALWSLTEPAGAARASDDTNATVPKAADSLSRSVSVSCCTALFTVAVGHVLRHSSSQSQQEALALLSRLARLVPSVTATVSDTSSTTAAMPDSVLPEPVRQRWLISVSRLTEQLCSTDTFIKSILFDLHYSRTASTTETGSHYRYLVSYLFSSQGGLRLLAEYGKRAMLLESRGEMVTAEEEEIVEDEEGREDSPATAEVSPAATAAATVTTSLELCSSIFAWPLYTFSMSNVAELRLETSALFAKLVLMPGLLRQLWCLYRDRSPSLHRLLVETREDLTARFAAADQQSTPEAAVAVTLAGSDPPNSVLVTVSRLIRMQRHLFYDASPALSVLFFALLSYYVDAVDFERDLKRGTVLEVAECTGLILALKDIVHRAHMSGVVPDHSGEAVAHLAFTLLAKLHAVNESAPFLASNAAWISVTDASSLRPLVDMTPSRWDELATEYKDEVESIKRHRNGSSTEASDEEERTVPGSAQNEEAPPTSSPTLRHPGDDPLFRHSCVWRSDQRIFCLLLHAPFMVPFARRGTLLTTLLMNQPMYGSSRFDDDNNFIAHRGAAFVDAYDRFHDHPDAAAMFSVRFRDPSGDLEPGYGAGVYRELMGEVCKEGFSAEHGLFKQTDDGDLYPNPFSFEATSDPDHLKKIQFLGTMAGRAIRDGILQDVPFAHHFRNSLLGRTNSINNLRRFDAVLYEHLLALLRLSEDDIKSLELTFTYTVNALGVTREVDLIQDGANVPVTRRNCLHYIQLVADFKLNREGAQQTRAFLQGLVAIVHPSWLRFFDTGELNNLLCGEPGKMDVDDWRRNTVYNSPDQVNDETVKIFWKVVDSLTAKQQSQLLQFSTAMRHPPLFGFRYLSPPFKVQLLTNESEERLPSAATCFSTLKLPPYKTFEAARTKIIAAIEETNTFGFS